jgi:hypothetical protein
MIDWLNPGSNEWLFEMLNVGAIPFPTLSPSTGSLCDFVGLHDLPQSISAFNFLPPTS